MPRKAKKIAVKKVVTLMVGPELFGGFLHESAQTAAKNRTNLSSHRRSCRKPLDRSRQVHLGMDIGYQNINVSNPKGYLEGDRRFRFRFRFIYLVILQTQETSAKTKSGRCRRGHLEKNIVYKRSHIHKCGKDAKQLDRSGPNLAHVCIFIWEWT